MVKVLIPVVVLAGLAVGATALIRSQGDAGVAAASGTLDMYSVQRTSFDITTTSSGELEAKNSTEIRNKLEGGQATILEIVEEGKFVKAGDLLIKLNDEDIKNKISEADSQLESAKAEEISARENYEIQISQNDSAYRAAELKLDLARLELRQWLEGEVKQKRQDNALAIDRGRRERDRTKDKHDQSVNLEKEGFLSKDQLKLDELAYLQAEADLDKAELAQRVYEEFQYPKDEKTKQSAVDEAAAELERVKKKNNSELASKKAALENRTRQTVLRDEALAKLKAQLAATTITAPKEGLVVYGTTAEMSRNGWFRGDGPLAIGSQVYPNQLLIVLPDTTEMVATVKVHESLAGKVREGLPATIKVEALGGRTFEGKVQNISVLAEQTGRWMDPNLREYTVKIAITSGTQSGLKPSMRCESELRLGRVDDALAVPVQAVFNEGPLRYAFVPASGGKFVKRPIKIGRRSDRFIEVAAGIEADEQVLLRQPVAGEILGTPWSEAQLAAVGFHLNAEGKVEAIAGAAPDGPGGREGRGPKGRGPATASAAPATTTAENTAAPPPVATPESSDPPAESTAETPAATPAVAPTEASTAAVAKPAT
ncbi:MAG: HlyD family efflux transporter periplasmic adaptor subunit [Phycisphaeraceae bacterium]|nr:HlyD family efflux transporter periplasmic adaptor subunit [Phycisphaeraceae bacterium]